MKKSLLILALLVAAVLPWSAKAQDTCEISLASLPWSEGFESGSQDGMLPCWTVFQSCNNVNPCVDRTGYHRTGQAMMSMWAGNGGTNILALPPFEDLYGLQMTFWARQTGVPTVFVVGVMDDNDQFVGMDTITGLPSGYDEYTVDLTEYADYGNRPAFKNIAGCVHLDDITVSEIPSCLPPVDLTVDNITIDGAELHFNYGDQENEWNLILSTTEITNPSAYTGTVENLYDTNYTFSDLTANTLYYVYLQSSCDLYDLSEWVSLSFRTACAPMTYADLPYTEMFDSYGNGTEDWVPCWSRIQGGAFPRLWGNTSVSGNSLYFNGYYGQNLAILPELDASVAVNGLMVSFWARQATTIEVGVMTDPTDASTFHMVASVTPSGTTFEEFEVGLSAYQDTGRYVALRTAANSSASYVDNLTLSLLPECSRPYAQAVAGVTPYSATLTWEDLEAASYTLYWGANADMAYATDSATTMDTFYLVAGLQPQTTYYAWVRTNCADGNMSNYAFFGQFSTPCAYATVPFHEDFDSLPGSGNIPLPACWTRVSGVGTSQTSNPCPYVDAGYAHSGTTAVSLYHASYNQQPNVFALPSFDSLQYLTIDFWAYKWNPNSSQLFQVGVMEGSTFVPVETIDVTTSWEEYTVNFAGYQGNGTQPAFYAVNSGADLRIHIDDIEVYYTPDCPRPSGLHLDSATTSEIYLSWAQGGDQASSWEVYFDTVQPTDFDNLSGQETTTQTSLYLSGLEANTTLYVYVRNDCNDQWVGPVQMRTEMCDGGCDMQIVMHDSYGDGWNGNKIQVIQSGLTLGEATIASGNSNTESIHVCPNIPIQFNWVSGSYSQETSFEINDAFGEELYACTNGSTISGTFFTTSTSCQQSSCAKPRDLYADQIDSASAWIFWMDSTGTAWDVEFGPAGFTPGQGTTVNAYEDSVQITGLTANTLYDVYVTSLCSDTNVTSNVYTFRSGCGTIVTFPWTEDFESYGDSEVPACWQQLQTVNYYGTITPSISAYGGNMGPKHISMTHQTTGDINLIATPMFSDLTGYQMTFWAKAYYFQYYGAAEFTVGAVTDSGAYIPTDTITLTNDWTQYTVYLDTLAQYGHRIGFRSLSTDSYQGTQLDDINIDLQPSCLPVTALTVNQGSATMSSLEISWTDNNNSAWEYIFDTLPITNDALYTPTQTTANPTTITGLATGKNYYIYVRPVCAAYTPWVSAEGHTMLCNDPCNIEVVTGGTYAWAREDGAYVDVQQNGVTVGTTVDAGTTLIYVCPNVPIQFFYHSGSYSYYDSYAGLDILDAWGNPIYSQLGMTPSSTTPFYTYTTDCQAPGCVAPRHLAAGNIQPNSANITWTDSLANSWTIMWSNASFNPANPGAGVSSDTSNTTSFTITGLQPQTTYHVYVRANCTDTTIWSSELTFTTACGYITQFPWVESFEGLTGSWVNAPLGLPQCWDIYANYVNVNPCPFGGYAHAGQACVSIHGVGAGSSNWFALPPLPSLDSLYFGWYGIMQDAQAAGDPSTVHATVFSVGVLDSAGNHFAIDTIVMNNKYEYYQVDLNRYAPYGNRISIYARLDTTGNFHIYMDDYIIDSLSPCKTASNLVADTTTTTTATLNWDENGRGYVSGYTIEVGPVGFTPGIGQGQTYNVTHRPATIGGLTPSTAYEFYVRPNCGNSGVGNWSWFPGSFSTECAAIAVDYFNPLFESFENPNTIVPVCWQAPYFGNNSPDRNSDQNPVDGNYCIQFGRSTNTYLVSPQLIAAGDMTLAFYYKNRESYYTEQMSVGYSLSSDDPTDTTWVWIDTFSVSNTDWQRFVDTIPAAAQWICVHSHGSAYANTFVDSLLISVDAVTGCMKPATLAVSDLGFYNATLTWRSTGTDHELQYKAASDPFFSASIPVSGTTYALTGLSHNTSYSVRVRQNCGSGDYSDWAETSFVTPFDTTPCYVPTNVLVGEVTNSTAALTWTPGADEQSWEVAYWYGGVVNTITVSEPQATLIGLSYPMDYSATVRAICGFERNQASEWSDTVQFTTLECPEPTGLQVSGISQHQATASWNGQAESWTAYISYDESTNEIFDSIATSTPSCTFSNLEADHRYYISVVAHCGEGWNSLMTSFVQFRTPVGIDQAESSAVSLYPNPATDQVTILGYEGEAQIVDMTGRTVLRTSSQTIDLSTLTPGAYFVKLGATVKKLIVK